MFTSPSLQCTSSQKLSWQIISGAPPFFSGPVAFSASYWSAGFERFRQPPALVSHWLEGFAGDAPTFLLRHQQVANCKIWDTFRLKEDSSSPSQQWRRETACARSHLYLISKTFYYLDWRPQPVFTVYTAFRKYEVTILSSMTEVEFSLVEPASLCRAAGEDSNLLCFSSAAETELQVMEAFYSSLRWDWLLWRKLLELFEALW
jgi:hypothetical protein